MLPFKANIILISGSYLDISPLSLMPWNVATQGTHHTDIRKLSGYQSTISNTLKCCYSRQTSHWYQEAIWISVHCLWCLEMLSFKANITLISGSYLDISPLSMMSWNDAIHGKHHTDIRKLSGHQSTISDALQCCHSRQTSYWYQEAIWTSVNYLWCLEMLSFKANITLISGSYLDISTLSLIPWNVAIHGKHHTDIRKLSGHQSTISDALQCCHSRQTSYWYQEAIWIPVHCLWCLEMLPFTANIILISGSYLDISPLSLMPWNVVIQGKHHTDIRKLSGYQYTFSDTLKCCHSRQTSYWYQEAIWTSVHYLWCLEMLPFTASIILISESYLDISPLSLMPWNVAIQGKHHTDIRKLSGYHSTVSDALKCCHSRQISHWYQEAIWISFHCLWCLEMLPFTANITLISGSYLDISPLSLMPWNVAIQGKHHTDIRKLSGYQSTISNALKYFHSQQTSYWYQKAIWI